MESDTGVRYGHDLGQIWARFLPFVLVFSPYITVAHPLSPFPFRAARLYNEIFAEKPDQRLERDLFFVWRDFIFFAVARPLNLYTAILKKKTKCFVDRRPLPKSTRLYNENKYGKPHEERKRGTGGGSTCSSFLHFSQIGTLPTTQHAFYLFVFVFCFFVSITRPSPPPRTQHA